jgi:hypothetical protein
MIVVTGPPRSGTSLLMQVLAAGGLNPLTSRDAATPRTINQRGLWELHMAGQHPIQATAPIASDATRCVKLFLRPLRTLLTAGVRPTAVIATDRPTAAVHASQAAALPNARLLPADLEQSRARAFRATTSAGVPLHLVSFTGLLDEPIAETCRLAAFLAPLVPLKLDRDAMAATPDPSLVRFR